MVGHTSNASIVCIARAYWVSRPLRAAKSKAAEAVPSSQHQQYQVIAVAGWQTLTSRKSKYYPPMKRNVYFFWLAVRSNCHQLLVSTQDKAALLRLSLWLNYKRSCHQRSCASFSNSANTYRVPTPPLAPNIQFILTKITHFILSSELQDQECTWQSKYHQVWLRMMVGSLEPSTWYGSLTHTRSNANE